jgi:hypothetical protein
MPTPSKEASPEICEEASKGRVVEGTGCQIIWEGWQWGCWGWGLIPSRTRGAIVGGDQRGKPLPAQPWASATMPALVMDAGNNPAWMLHANRAFASVLPNAQYRTLEGQTHMLKPKAHAPALARYPPDNTW